MAIGINHPRSFADIEGVRTAWYRSGEGPTVVLLHGGAPGASSDLNWFRNFDVLVEAGFDVVAFDQPGFGYSSAPSEWTIEFRYRHARAFLQWLGVKSVYLIGNSIGGLLCTLLAHRLKNSGDPKIEGIVLAAPFPQFEMSAAARERYLVHRSRLASVEASFDGIKALCSNTFYNADCVTDDIVELRLSMLQGDNWTAYKKRAEAGNAFDNEAIRNEVIDMPALVMWGLNDRSIPPEVGMQAIGHFNNAQFLFLPHCGHWPQTEHPDAFNRAALNFLQSRLQQENLYKET